MSAESPIPRGETGSPSASLELLRRIQGGDSRAWEDLYFRYRDRLILSIRCRLGADLRARVQDAVWLIQSSPEYAIER